MAIPWKLVCLSAAAVLWPLALTAQDKDEAAKKALEHVRKELKAGKVFLRFPEHCFAGFAFMAEGSTPEEGEYSADLKGCIDFFMQFPGAPDQENWYLAFATLFLAEVHKRWPSEDRAARLAELVKRIGETQEKTGGWSHRKGYSYPIGAGIPDLAIVTGLVLAGLGNAKAAGIEIPKSALDRGLAYCRKLSSGSGLAYGTNNPVGDAASTRAAGVVMALYFMEKRHSLYGKFAAGVRQNVRNVDRGHSFPPIHFFNSAVANYVVGQFSTFKRQWVNKLLSMQESDGGIWLKNHERKEIERNEFKNNIVGTAVLALVLMMDRDNVFKKIKEEKSGSGGGGKKGSPFRRKKR
jgi:hypothetical protein